MKSEAIADVLDGLVPNGCEIYPYDTVFEIFSASIPSRAFLLCPTLESYAEDIHEVLFLSDQPDSRFSISEENFDFWSALEVNWTRGGFLGTKWRLRRLLDRSWWNVSGRDYLASESPAHIEFPATVRHLVREIEESARAHRQLLMLRSAGSDTRRLCELLTPSQMAVLHSAADDCRRVNRKETNVIYEESAAIDVLEELGWLTFRTVESCERIFAIAQIVFEVCNTRQV